MNRRTFLFGSAVLVQAGAGCLQARSGAPPTDTGSDGGSATPDVGNGAPLSFDSRSVTDPIDVPLVDGGLAHGSNGDRYYATLVTDRAGLDRFDFEYMEGSADVDEETVALVRETSFDSTFLLVVQTVLPSGSMSFDLEAVGRVTDEEISARVRTPPATGGDAEAVRATILARVSLDDGPAPTRCEVTYLNDPSNGGETTVFDTDG